MAVLVVLMISGLNWIMHVKPLAQIMGVIIKTEKKYLLQFWIVLNSYIISHLRFYVNLHTMLITANSYLGLTICQHILAIISKWSISINPFISHKNSVITLILQMRKQKLREVI